MADRWKDEIGAKGLTEVNSFALRDAESLHLALMTEEGRLYTLWIPGKAEGKYEFRDERGACPVNFLSIQARQSWWHVLLEKGGYILDPEGRQRASLCLGEKGAFRLEQAGRRYVLYVEPCHRDSKIFHNYQMQGEGEISIGRRVDCDIYYPASFVSRHHALMSYRQGQWSIRDEGSGNGVFVNERKVVQADLSLGDSIYIVGLRILVGTDFLSINDGNARVIVNPRSLVPIFPFGPASACEQGFATEPASASEQGGEGAGKSGAGRGCRFLPVDNDSSRGEKEAFNRLPRRKMPLNPSTIRIEEPPMPLHDNQIPLLLRMGGSMVMGGSSLLRGSYVSMLSMVLFPMMTQKYTDKQKAEYEERRVKKYRLYLRRKYQEIQEECQKEEQALNRNYPALARVLQFPEKGERLWERRNVEADFMSLRLGHGQIPLLGEYEYPEERFNLDEDFLENEMHQLTDQKAMLENVPILLPLQEYVVSSVIGSYGDRLALLKCLILQAAMQHSYDEVKMVFLMEEKDLSQIPEVRYLPHVWEEDRGLRYIATDTAGAYLIGEGIRRELEEVLEQPQELKKSLKDHPFFLIFAFSKRILDSMEVLKTIWREEMHCCVSTITFFRQVPKEAQALIKLRPDGFHVLQDLKEGEKGQNIRFQLDDYDRKQACVGLRRLANTRLRREEGAFTLPRMLSFLELYGVGRVEHLNPLKRWAENDPGKSLAAPLGLAADGSQFQLDLHEKYQGPHGLVAGSTGSGKSEFLITYILSMAVNYHPDEVAFVLIDYKGGGLAGAFDNPAARIRLPHLAGTITNLDRAAISRSLASIQAELKRRQRVFQEIKQAGNEGTMDIYDYQRLYRNGKVAQPMPHLIIISDEFAELKAQEPEFMEQLVSAARIGRSLGIHLILATQKPSGVVNDQISSNSRFRVCLKVQTRSDSEEMLRRPEAAQLKETGRFYLQVGYNEYFALGQSAWCGAPYEPQDTVVINRDESVDFLDDMGRKVLQVKPPRKKRETETSQLVAIVRYLSNLADREGIKQKNLWMDPLPSQISLQDLLAGYCQEGYCREGYCQEGYCSEEYWRKGYRSEESCGKRPCQEKYLSEEACRSGTGIRAVIGMADDPESQSQYPLELDFQALHHLVIAGENRGGKSTLVETILYSLASLYGPDQVQFYLLDFSSKLLKVFDCLPHCGGVFTEGEESQISALFLLIQSLIEERKALFQAAQVNSFEAYRQVGQLPLIYVIIDPAPALQNWKEGQEISMNLNHYLRAGATYGIKFILTCARISELLVRIQQEIGTGIGIQAKDRFEYQDILGEKCSLRAAAQKGRGMCLVGGRPLEFQTARFQSGHNEQERLQALRQSLRELAERYKGLERARRLSAFSQDQTYQDFLEGLEGRRIPIGYSLRDKRKICMPLKQLFCTTVYLGNPEAREVIFGNFLQAYAWNRMDLVLIKAAKDSIFDTESLRPLLEQYPADLQVLDSTKEDSVKVWELLAAQIKERRRNPAQAQEQVTIQTQVQSPMQVQAQTQTPESVSDICRPLMILFERYLDYCAYGDESCNGIMPTIYQKGKGLGIYFTAFFYPGDDHRIGTDPTYQAFNPDGFQLFFGGRFHQQGLASLPPEFANRTEPMKKHGSLLMHYRAAFYPLFMPCGPQKEEETDPDEMPII